ncbi:CoA ester lyase [Castellaniella sp.]|uniref:HpcH/HpaI aldolase/citrate lyase family protein n=1 Tax=Castellaniella sp. TaxID=1955812 RepID=UPI002AFE6B6F|nr:CoA ester lyase [Castellaniella sp.]
MQKSVPAPSLPDAFQVLRTALFVPATRPERFAKAGASGADAVIIDLEDAVEASAKDAAREAMCQFLQGPDAENAGPWLVRINGPDTSWHDADLAACRGLAHVGGIVLPKAETAEQVARVAVAGKPVFPIIESARGLHDLQGISGAPGIARLIFGALDLMLDLGVAPDTPASAVLLDHARCRLLLASRVQGLAAPLDGVHADFSDTAGLGRMARNACDMGFGGMLCIHPVQVAEVHKAFAPAPQALEWASRVMAEVAAGRQTFSLDGRMVDQPVIQEARRILARAPRVS